MKFWVVAHTSIGQFIKLKEEGFESYDKIVQLKLKYYYLEKIVYIIVKSLSFIVKLFNYFV